LEIAVEGQRSRATCREPTGSSEPPMLLLSPLNASALYRFLDYSEWIE